MENPTEYKNISIYLNFFLSIVPLTSPDLPLCTENVSKLPKMIYNKFDVQERVLVIIIKLITWAKEMFNVHI